jgi:UDP-N-acetyl-D-mannosaminuronate dehydrogenase
MNSIKSVSVCGLGKLGACMAATFAARGLNVIGVDIDPEKIRKVNAGEPPVDEPSLAETIKEGGERLRATDDPAETVKTTQLLLTHSTSPVPDQWPNEVRSSFGRAMSCQVASMFQNRISSSTRKSGFRNESVSSCRRNFRSKMPSFGPSMNRSSVS